ncbi:MAG: sulfatase-like hydrolase/transferase [Deltaproteobacteria bacterium]|nr:sulfatase-like hydrolase/transferase [Deltaproteobacteria bacterium]
MPRAAVVCGSCKDLPVKANGVGAPFAGSGAKPQREISPRTAPLRPQHAAAAGRCSSRLVAPIARTYRFHPWAALFTRSRHGSPRPVLAVLAALAAAACAGPANPGVPAAPPLVARPPSAPRAAQPRPRASVPPPVMAFAAAAGTGASAADASPNLRRVPLNVLLVVVDAMRADMPWAGYARDIAPRLTALERQSVAYTRAYAVSSYTAMSVGGLLAGRYPSELDRSGYFFSHFPASVLTFPELLQQAGIRTLAAHAHFYFDEKAGFRQGFDDYRMVPGLSADNVTDRNITSPQHADLAIAMLSDPKTTAGQFFAWFHFMDPHEQYMPHDDVAPCGSRPRDRYDGEILFADRHIGRLLDFVNAQPWGGRTAIVITSDHGEAFGEKGAGRHGFELWEAMVRVPLFLAIPGVAPRRIDVPRSAIDLAPTILELMGLPPHPGFQGHSLLAEIRGELPPEPRDVVVDLPRTNDNDRRRALIGGRHKLISFGDDFRYELYNVVADPEERIDLRRRDPKTYQELLERYRERSKTIRDICPEMRHRLKNKLASRPC